MKTCFLFPGQGAQYPGMGKDLYETDSRVRDLFVQVSDITGRDFSDLLFESDEKTLKISRNAQSAITLISLAACLVLEDRGIVPDICAGFSLGEYAALWRAGVLDVEDLFPLVEIRGEAMEAAGRLWDSPEGPSGMMAVLGLSREEVEACLHGLDDVYLANHNAPTQVVLSGTHAGLAAAEKAAEEAGALKLVHIKVSGPFHSPLMRQARSALEARIDDFSFRDPSIELFSNVTGGVLKTAREIKSALLDQIVSPVLWMDEEKGILAGKPERILEVGPGQVLRGLWRSFHKDLKCLPAGTMEAMDKII